MPEWREGLRGAAILFAVVIAVRQDFRDDYRVVVLAVVQSAAPDGPEDR